MPKSVIKPFKWTDTVEHALNYVFAGRYSQAEIASKCEVSPRTIWGWIQHPEFQQRLEAKRADLAAALATVTYADKTRRIIALNEMAEQARVEFEAHPRLLETRPSPKGGEPVINESFNRDAFESFRGALDDIAKEQGQRKTGNETTVNINQQQQVLFVLPEVLNEAGQPQVTYDIPSIEPTEDDHQAAARSPGNIPL